MTSKRNPTAIKLSPSQLQDRLKTKLADAAIYDERVLAQHYAKNRDVANARREGLQAIIALDDDTLAELDSWKFRNRFDQLPSATQCPMSMVKRFTDVIKFLGADGRKLITINRGDSYAELLTWELDAESAKLC